MKLLLRFMDNHFRQNIDWKSTATRNGYNARILYSVLNKDLRRGKLDNSIAVAKELYDSGEVFRRKLWQRLITVSAEDVGLGNVSIYIAMCNAYTVFHKNQDFCIIRNAIDKICMSPKSRYADEVLNYALMKYIAPNKSYFTSTQRETVLNDSTHEQLSDALKNKKLIESCGIFLSLAFSGYEYETQAWNTLKQNVDVWKYYIELAHQMSRKMKPGKNDRVMAGVLFITASERA